MYLQARLMITQIPCENIHKKHNPTLCSSSSKLLFPIEHSLCLCLPTSPQIGPLKSSIRSPTPRTNHDRTQPLSRPRPRRTTLPTRRADAPIIRGITIARQLRAQLRHHRVRAQIRARVVVFSLSRVTHGAEAGVFAQVMAQLPLWHRRGRRRRRRRRPCHDGRSEGFAAAAIGCCCTAAAVVTPARDGVAVSTLVFLRVCAWTLETCEALPSVEIPEAVAPARSIDFS